MDDTYIESEKDIAFRKLMEEDSKQQEKINVVSFKLAKLEIANTLLVTVLREVVGSDHPILSKVERILSSG